MALNFAQEFVMDSDAEIHGVWMPYGEEAEVKIARSNNKEARKLREMLSSPFQARPGFRRAKKATEEESRAISVEVLCRACIKALAAFDLSGVKDHLLSKGIDLGYCDWTTPEDRKEAEAFYTPELGMALCDFDGFYTDMILCATNEDSFKAHIVEAAEGNSSRRSTSAPGGEASVKTKAEPTSSEPSAESDSNSSS